MASFDPRFGQKKRHLNPKVFTLLCSGVSLRRAAWILGSDPKTMARKLIFCAQQERLRHDRMTARVYGPGKITRVVFDEMETSQHSKLKPLSIALAVSEERVILGFEVSLMPAKGLLAEKSRQKYGFRPDHRPQALRKMLSDIRPHLHAKAEFLSDQNPYYPSAVKSVYPSSAHFTEKSRRACVVGQGELKSGGFDPLFALNHTAACFRANVNRLFRRTWCTTKRIDRLRDHLMLYTAFHNRVIWRAKKRGVPPESLFRKPDSLILSAA